MSLRFAPPRFYPPKFAPARFSAEGTDGAAFIFEVETVSAAESFTIPCQDFGVFAATVDWGDGTHSDVTSYNDADLSHVYASAGLHTISVSGSFPNIYFGGGAGAALKMRRVLQLGDTGWSTLYLAFHGCSNMTSFVSGTADTSSVTSMSACFRDCSSLTTLDVSSLNTSSVTAMSACFRDCSSLTTLDVSAWDTSSVTIMSACFFGCSSLTTLDVSAWDTSSVTTMSACFRGCSSLPTLDVSAWDTSSVTTMSACFRDCSSLTTLDVSAWDTSSVTTMARCFEGCSSLTGLDVSEWDITGLNSTSSLDKFCIYVDMGTANYDPLLVAWEAQAPLSGMAPNFGTSKYTPGGAEEAARTSLASTYSWTITDGGPVV